MHISEWSNLNVGFRFLESLYLVGLTQMLSPTDITIRKNISTLIKNVDGLGSINIMTKHTLYKLVIRTDPDLK